ncbi:hypothetical protein AB0A05_26865 [Streptomyces sp. NPDC046374]|uniref:hypothetical protein n=1 Tax=Streptomyces sp. NPDC046374 TaxID=3154917 RepID=UPI003408F837
MPPTITRYYLDRTQLAELAGLADSKSVRQMENAGRLLSPDVIVGDEDAAGKVSAGWDRQRAVRFFQETGRLDDTGRPVVGLKPGALTPEQQAKEAEFMGKWTSVPKRYLGGLQVMRKLAISNAYFHDRRAQGKFPQPDVVIGKAPTRIVDGKEVPTTQSRRGVVHGWDAVRMDRFAQQEAATRSA